MSQFSLDKLQQDLGAVPENERTPELQALLGFATTMEAAEEHLRTAAAARQAAGGAPSEALEPDVFKASSLQPDGGAHVVPMCLRYCRCR